MCHMFLHYLPNGFELGARYDIVNFKEYDLCRGKILRNLGIFFIVKKLGKKEHKQDSDIDYTREENIKCNGCTTLCNFDLIVGQNV